METPASTDPCLGSLGVRVWQPRDRQALQGTQVLSCLAESPPSCPYSTFSPREKESESIRDKSITLFYAPRDSKNNYEYRKANTLVSTLGVNILLEKKNPSSTGFALC